MSDHTPYILPHGNGGHQHVFQRRNDSKSLPRLSKHVGRCRQKKIHAKGRELSLKIYSQLQAS